ncbi:phage protease [Terasakiispira papahanaumokuakeensis]|uniref:phage protease n=1 Tax=Terasakiispira papahanaumokuakeensis TaxID=197479 RepID=UPI000A00BD83|nr:phage protease [Terasakiispira papahanaumokuakeensis]
MKTLTLRTQSPFAEAFTGAPLAILTRQQDADPVAVLSFELSTAQDGWYHLLPAGRFSAKDGRPNDVPGGQWFLDATTAAELIARNASLANDRPVDYEHQTRNSEKNGQPAPAAGWFNSSELQWRDGSGLWIKPRWTKRAQAFIDDKEYRYLSAVFPYESATGKPLWLHSVALTNDPGLDGLHPLASLKAGDLPAPATRHPEKLMDPTLQAMLKALGFNVADDAKPEDMPKRDDVMAALKTVQDKAATADTLATQVATLKASDPSAKPDPAQYVPIAALTELQSQLAVLKAGADASELESLITDARKDGRLLPSMEGWAKDLGEKDMAALKAYLAKAAPLAALKSTQTQDKAPPAKTGEDGLTPEELEAAKLTGKTPKEYAALKAALD